MGHDVVESSVLDAAKWQPVFDAGRGCVEESRMRKMRGPVTDDIHDVERGSGIARIGDTLWLFGIAARLTLGSSVAGTVGPVQFVWCANNARSIWHPHRNRDFHLTLCLSRGPPY